MDKNTLANYGWVVCVVLVLSMMIALATPFATVIKNSVVGTTNGLTNNLNNALADSWKDSTESGNESSSGGSIAPRVYKFNDTIVSTGAKIVSTDEEYNEIGWLNDNLDSTIKIKLCNEEFPDEPYYIIPVLYGADFYVFGNTESELGGYPVKLWSSVLSFFPIIGDFELIDYGNYEEWFKANATLVSDGSDSGNETSDPDLNKYGFYFNQPYRTVIDGTDVDFVFYEDGAVSTWSVLGHGYSPAGTASYAVGSITIDEDVAVVSADGKSFTYEDTEGAVVYNLNKVAQGSVQTGKVYKGESCYPDEIIFELDGSISTNDTTVWSFEDIEYFDNYFVVEVLSEKVYGCVYPDGTMLFIGLNFYILETNE